MIRLRSTALATIAAAITLGLAGCASTPASGPMGFFVTSSGSGKGGDLGGLAGADTQCKTLATAAGAGQRNWRAYLSLPPTFASGTNPAVPAVNARDRIGKGPWYNAKGQLIAADVVQLHNGKAMLDKTTALDERGNAIKGRGDTPNEHDMLTGSRDDGTAFAPQQDSTCKGWTSSSDGSAIVGHHDRIGPLAENWAQSWNFSHPTVGCSQEALIKTGGAGRFYCFAAD
jgi:hypothetical protein